MFYLTVSGIKFDLNLPVIRHIAAERWQCVWLFSKGLEPTAGYATET